MRKPIFYLVFIGLLILGFSCSDAVDDIDITPDDLDPTASWFVSAFLDFGQDGSYTASNPSGPLCTELTPPSWILGRWMPARDYNVPVYWRFSRKTQDNGYSSAAYNAYRPLCTVSSMRPVFYWTCQHSSICGFEEYIKDDHAYVIRKMNFESEKNTYLIFERLSSNSICFSYLDQLGLSNCEETVYPGQGFVSGYKLEKMPSQ